MAIKILVELSKDEHPTSGEVFEVLDIQAHMIGPAEHVKIRDEIAELALDSGPRNIVYTHMDTDSLKVKIKDADEDKVRRFEEAGWT